MQITPAPQRIEQTLDLIKARDEAFHPLAELFGPLFEARELMLEHLLASLSLFPEADPDKLSAGASVLAGANLSQWDEAFRTAAARLLPVLAEALSLDPETQLTLGERFAAPGELAELARLRLDGGEDRLMALADSLGIVPPAVLLHAVDTICGPVLGALAKSLGDALDAVTWERGYCPVCGAKPALALLALPDNDGNEYLVGGGGKKFLHCSLCGHDWHYGRTVCASCGNKDDNTREVLSVNESGHERIEACRACGNYLLCVDLRQYETLPHPDVIQMGLIHLDVLAQDKHLRPLVPTLWNTLTEVAS